MQDSSAQGALLFWENGQPRFNVYGDHFTVTFAPVPARYVRLLRPAFKAADAMERLDVEMAKAELED